MCYSVYLSTDSALDLSSVFTGGFHFLPASDVEVAVVRGVLKNQHIWRLESEYGGCSCHFRHLMAEGIQLGFGPPEDWFPEDADDVDATGAVYDLISSLVNGGSKVDLVDTWNDALPSTVSTRTLSLSEVDRAGFRFFEDWRFEVVP